VGTCAAQTATLSGKVPVLKALREMRNTYKTLVEPLKERNRSEHLNADGRIILKWIFGK
jgi:hypothetical protein